MSAAVRYLTQRYTMPTNRTKGLLTDIGTEELAHWEIVGTMIYQLLKGVPTEVLRQADLGGYFTEHDNAVYPAEPSQALELLSSIALSSWWVRAIYSITISDGELPFTQNNLRSRFLRAREVVHFQRFGEALNDVQEELTRKKIF